MNNKNYIKSIFTISGISILLILILLIIAVFSSCTDIDKADRELALLRYEGKILEEKLKNKKLELERLKLAPEGTIYLITIEISKSSFTLDIGQHIKDHFNTMTLVLPVSKEFYFECEEGKKLNNSFRASSFLLSGSISWNNIKIIKKEMKQL